MGETRRRWQLAVRRRPRMQQSAPTTEWLLLLQRLLSPACRILPLLPVAVGHVLRRPLPALVTVEPRSCSRCRPWPLTRPASPRMGSGLGSCGRSQSRTASPRRRR